MTNLDHTFAALADATRRKIISRLKDGEASLSSLAEPFAMSQTAVSKHVKVLTDAGLVTVSKRGRTRYCSLSAAPMREAVNWLGDYEQFWAGQLEALALHVSSDGDDT